MSGMTEFLVGWGRGEENGEEIHVSVTIRQLTENEWVAVNAGARLLTTLVARNSFTDLQHARDEVEAAYQVALATKVGSPPDLGLLQRRYHSWLGAHRAFVDRTHHWLSETVGQGSDKHRDCAQFFRDEFDANFGYRLTCALRNVSEHQDSVLNSIAVHNHLVNGIPVQDVAANIDCGKVVAADTGGRIRRATRDEMLALSSELDGGRIIGTTMGSCDRIYARIFGAFRPEVDEIVSLADALHNEAVTAGADQAVFMSGESLQNIGQGPIELKSNPKSLSERALNLIPELESLAANAPLKVEASDLIRLDQ